MERRRPWLHQLIFRTLHYKLQKHVVALKTNIEMHNSRRELSKLVCSIFYSLIRRELKKTKKNYSPIYNSLIQSPI